MLKWEIDMILNNFKSNKPQQLYILFKIVEVMKINNLVFKKKFSISHKEYIEIKNVLNGKIIKVVDDPTIFRSKNYSFCSKDIIFEFLENKEQIIEFFSDIISKFEEGNEQFGEILYLIYEKQKTIFGRCLSYFDIISETTPNIFESISSIDELICEQFGEKNYYYYK